MNKNIIILILIAFLSFFIFQSITNPEKVPLRKNFIEQRRERLDYLNSKLKKAELNSFPYFYFLSEKAVTNLILEDIEKSIDDYNEAIELINILIMKNNIPEQDVSAFKGHLVDGLNHSESLIGRVDSCPDDFNAYMDPIDETITPEVNYTSNDIVFKNKTWPALLEKDLAGVYLTEDFNNDGFIDVISSSWTMVDGTKIYMNNQGILEDQTEQFNLKGSSYGNLSKADFDNDGFTDLLILANRTDSAPVQLLKNINGEKFQNVTEDSGLSKVKFPAYKASWADINNDGHLDLYIIQAHKFNQNDLITMRYSVGKIVPESFESYPNQLYLNKGDGTFMNITNSSGLYSVDKELDAVWADIDGD